MHHTSVAEPLNLWQLTIEKSILCLCFKTYALQLDIDTSFSWPANMLTKLIFGAWLIKSHFLSKLYRLVLKRKLSNLQWMAVVLLAVGTTTSQVCEHFETLFPFVLAYTIGLCLCYLTKLLIQTCYKKWTGGLTGKKNLVWSV